MFLKAGYLLVFLSPVHIYIFLNKFIYFFICLFVAALGLHCCAHFLQLWRAGATLRCGVWASHCGGFSCCGARALGTRASVVVARGLSSCGSWALECRLSSCGAWAQLLRGMWDLPRPGLEPVSPALAGRFSTTVPPGKSSNMFFKKQIKRQRKHLSQKDRYRARDRDWGRGIDPLSRV